MDESINVLPQGVTLFGDANVTLLDINNDGYIDFYLCGYVHDADAKRRYSGLFINNGNRTFTETSVLPSGKASNQATTLFADINGDGIMEMIFYGHEGSGSMYVYQYIDGEFVESMPIEGIYQTKTVVNSGVLADINNDGYYDLIANVYNGINNNPRERLFFFIGDEFGLFELNEELSSQVMGGSNGSVAVLDSNNDGILDFAVMGYNFNQNNNDAFCAIYKNTTYTATNAAPSAPSNLENSVDGNNVAVSYTHLDVYKRQGVYRALAQLTDNKYLYVKPDGTVYEGAYIYVNSLANKSLKWERTTSTNIGIDFTVLHNRLRGSIDVYKMNTKDLLIARTLPNIIGYASVMSNLGEVGNKGLEFTLSSVNIQKKNFIWSSTFNFSLNRNKILHLYGCLLYTSVFLIIK